MYNSLVQQLKTKGVLFDKGLSETEIKEIEMRYNIHFPKELLKLYSIALPISVGFYNWRDMSEENVRRMKADLVTPIEDLLQCPDDVDWSDHWGEEPEDEEQRKEIILGKIQKAPKMIPIFGHRYMAALDNSENPVFSIHGVDIICYGKDLITYLQTEFGIIETPQIFLNQLMYVPFWSDFL